MINKTTDKWKQLPLLFRLNFIDSDIEWLGLSQRKNWIGGERLSAIFGVLLLAFGFVKKELVIAGLLMIVLGMRAYCT